MWVGERRVLVEGEVCPELLENLETVRHVFQHWFGLDERAATIEARPRLHYERRSPEERSTVLFRRTRFTCGAPGEPLAVSRTTSGIAERRNHRVRAEVEDEEPFRLVLQALNELAAAAQVALIPVSSNLRALNPDWTFWRLAYVGPALCAVAHALSGRLSRVTIGLDRDLPNLTPHGSHPLVEPNFSSLALTIRCHGLTMSRLEKARLVAGWPPALRNLRVCNKPHLYEAGRLNCGECEKCIRTKLELLVAGVLPQATVFRVMDVTPGSIDALSLLAKVHFFYEELIAPLASVGRPDLAGAIRRALARNRKETGLAGRLRRFDRERLNGGLGSLKRAVLPPKARPLHR